MVDVAKAAGVVLGVSAPDLDALYDTVAAIEGLGYKELILDVTGGSIKDAYANAIQVRRAALKGQDRTFGYPSIVNVAKVAPDDTAMQTALASMFVIKYGSVIVMDSMTFDAATHTIGYHYRFMGPLDVDSGMKKDEMRELLLGVLRNETTLRVYKDEGYVFEYIYRSQRNPQNILFQAKFTDKDYR